MFPNAKGYSMQKCLMAIILFFFACTSYGATKLRTKTIKYYLNKTPVSIKITSSTQPGLIYFAMHENESTGARAVKIVIRKHGGKLIRIRQHGRRTITFRIRHNRYRFDPNRIFSKRGIRRTLRRYGRTSPTAVKIVDGFAKRLIKLLNKNLIITVHNNRAYGFGIKDFRRSGRLSMDTNRIYINPKLPPDDFYLVTTKALFKAAEANKYNVIWQGKDVGDNGSLSVYANRRNIPYINVEARHGHLKHQVKMLEDIQHLKPLHLTPSLIPQTEADKEKIKSLRNLFLIPFKKN